MHKLFHIAMTSAMVTAAVVAPSTVETTAYAAEEKVFTDVKPSSPHYTNIHQLSKRGVINGYANGLFKPEESVKRGQAAKMLANILGLDTENVKNPNFTDISSDHPYYGAIAALAERGILNGFTDKTYRPNETLTRGQMAKIVAKAFDLPTTSDDAPFTDIVNSPYKSNIATLYVHGVTKGKTATIFDASSAVTRGQLATFIVRAEAAIKQLESDSTTTPTTPPTTDTTNSNNTNTGTSTNSNSNNTGNTNNPTTPAVPTPLETFKTNVEKNMQAYSSQYLELAMQGTTIEAKIIDPASTDTMTIVQESLSLISSIASANASVTQSVQFNDNTPLTMEETTNKVQVALSLAQALGVGFGATVDEVIGKSVDVKFTLTNNAGTVTYKIMIQ